MFLIFVVSLYRTKNIFSPSSFYCLFWFLITFVSLTIVPVELKISGVFYLLLNITSFSLSIFFFKFPRKTFNKRCLLDVYRLRHLSIISIILSFFITIWHFELQGVTISMFFEEYHKTVGLLLEKRYYDDVSKNFFTSFMYPIIYISVAISANYCAIANKKFINTTMLMAFLSPLLLVLLQSSKGALLLGFFIYLGSYVFSFNNRHLTFKNFLNLKNLIISFFLICTILISFYSRGLSNYSNDYVIWKLSSYLYSYSIAQVFAFSDWFSFYLGLDHSNNYKSLNSYFGTYTFVLFQNFINTGIVIPDELYTDYPTWGNFLKTNIFTMYRGLIIDFGLIGSLLFIFILGFIFNLSYFIFSKSSKSVVSFSILIFFYVFCYQSYIASPFNYLSIYAFFFFCLVYRSYTQYIKL